MTPPRDDLERPTPSLKYLPQLDAIRAFAVLLVICHHWYTPPELPLGPIGVWIFFVLSGFLITRILLHSRATTAPLNRRALATFYIRRILRIFPLYYLILLVGLPASAALRADWPWYATYLQNFRMIQIDDQRHLFGVHLWTLAVEEQFYALWPLLILFLPRILLLPAILTTIAAAITSRCICAANGWTAFQLYAFTPSNLDTLAVGALLAWFLTHHPRSVTILRRSALTLAILIGIASPLITSRTPRLALMPLPTSLIALWLISHAANTIPGRVGRLFSFPPSLYIGRISYGLYIYHFFIPPILSPALHHFHIEDRTALSLAINSIITLGVTSLSWFAFERPINSLKKRYASFAIRAKVNLLSLQRGV